MLALASINSFSGPVNLSCAITPTVTTGPPTCTMSGSYVQISGGGTQSIKVNVGTTAPVITTAVGYVGFPPVAMPLPGMLLLLGSVGLLRNRKRLLAIAIPAMMCEAGVFGKTSRLHRTRRKLRPTPGTPSGTYTVTVTSTSGNLSHNLALQAIVQ